MGSHVKSKRKTLRQKHKIEKKVREHHRKVRREAKLKQGSNGKKKRKLSADPGIPNLFPFKREMLRKAEEQRHAEKMETLTKTKKRRREDADADAEDVEAKGVEVGKALRPSFVKEFNKLVEACDVILEVLDARDPLGCRCIEAERKILAAGGGTKRVILVLNKVDLVPREAAEKWLRYLRSDFPTVPFRASLQEQKSGLGHSKGHALRANAITSSDCLGAQGLIQLLKNYCRSLDLKRSIAIGVVGLPNVGKSSIINSLKRARATKVGPTPGLTRSLQEVHIDDNVRLIDSPGIILSKSEDSNSLILRNCMRVEQLEDPISPVESILKRCGNDALTHAYALPSFNGVNEFLALVAKKRGKIRKGGSLNVDAAARIVLQDWNSGRIPFYTLPPLGPASSHISSSIVSTWSKEFSLDSDTNVDSSVLDKLSDVDLRAKALFAQPESSAPEEQMIDADDDGHGDRPDDGDEEVGEVDMGDGSGENVTYAVAQDQSMQRDDPRAEHVEKGAMDSELNPQTNRARKTQLKKARKTQRKSDGNPELEDFDFEEFS